MDVILTHFNLLWCPLCLTCPTLHGLWGPQTRRGGIHPKIKSMHPQIKSLEKHYSPH